MDEMQALQGFVELMLKITINLVRAEPNQWPVGVGSGFIIPVGDRYRIVSAGHVIGATPSWAIETNPVSATEPSAHDSRCQYPCDNWPEGPN
jgi:hypothetical protein